MNSLLLDTNILVHAIDVDSKFYPEIKTVHDYEIAAIALTHKISNIVTFNKKDFEKIQELKPLHPNEVS